MHIDVALKRFGERLVLRGINLDLPRSSFTVITGPSGSGKTTLLRLIAGLDRDFAGSITGTGRLAMVFQEPRLMPWMTVRQNIALVRGRDIDAALAAVGLAGEADTYPRALSLGMARRAALARALAIRPETLLLDEPYVSLDEATAAEMRRLVVRLWQEHGFTCVLVTHAVENDRLAAQRLIRIAGAPATVVEDAVLATSSS
jgi:NitT/TauT family transport system ATP-binding protein